MTQMPIEQRKEIIPEPHKEAEDAEEDVNSYDREYQDRDRDTTRDELSKKMGESMLQGWAMLAEYCDGSLTRLPTSSYEKGRKSYVHQV